MRILLVDALICVCASHRYQLIVAFILFFVFLFSKEKKEEEFIKYLSMQTK